MKESHRKIVAWLRDRATIWSPARSKLAYVVLYYDRADHPNAKHPGFKVRRATLYEMEELGLVVLRNPGTEYGDTHWYLSDRLASE